MSRWVILATGQSLTQDDVDFVRGKCGVIAVSNAYELAPWADAMVSFDPNWWMAYGKKVKFAGRKFSAHGTLRTEIYRPPKAMNSGLMAMFVARDIYKATEIILLGFDMHGTHYFGQHVGHGHKPLINTNKKKFQEHIKQFALFSGPKVYNATKGSQLTCYDFVDLRGFFGVPG